MTAEVRDDGCLVVYAETHTEAYALKQWFKHGEGLININTDHIPTNNYDKACKDKEG